MDAQHYLSVLVDCESLIRLGRIRGSGSSLIKWNHRTVSATNSPAISEIDNKTAEL